MFIARKVCSKCGENKTVDEFYNDKKGKGGKASQCKSCLKAYEKKHNSKDEVKERLAKYRAEYHGRNKVLHKANMKTYYDANREKLTAQKRAYRKANREIVAAQEKKYQTNNSDKVNALVMKRRAGKLQRTPPWCGELDSFVKQEVYSMAKARGKALGVVFHVDHIIPLQGKNVSGMHVWNNLQVITARENVRKSNKYEVNCVY